MFSSLLLSLALAGQPSVADFGAKPCADPRQWKKCPDAWPAFRAAIDGMALEGEPEKNRGGSVLRVGPHTYRLSKNLVLDRGVQLRGESGSWVNGRSKLLFDPGAGLRVGTGRPVVQDLVIQSAEGRCRRPAQIKDGRCKTATDGVVIESRTHFERVYVTQFSGNGFRISADKHREISTNANGWMLVDCQAEKNSGSGLVVEGGDSNAGLTLRFQATNNGGWGIVERSFLGNTHVACGISSNEKGAVFSDKRGARNVFLGCYVENGKISADVKLRYPSAWLGGWGKPEGDALFLDDGVLGGGRWRIVNALDGENVVQAAFGSANMPRVLLEISSSTDDHPHRLEHGIPAPGWWGLRHANLDGRTSLAFSGAGAEDGPGQLWAPNGLIVGSEKHRRRITTGKDPERPRKGDVVLALDPEKDGWLGKVCVDPGDGKTPPRWRRFGKLE